MAGTWTTRGKQASALALAATLLTTLNSVNALALTTDFEAGDEPTVEADLSDAPSLAPDNIDPHRKGSITIFKHEYQTAEKEIVGDPTKDTDPIKSPGVEDVIFKAFQIMNAEGTEGINLTGDGANENWKKLQELNVSKACDSITALGTGTPTLEGYSFGEPEEFAPTGTDGKTKLDNLPQGAYVICETSAPGNVIAKAAPILLTIPYPDTNREEKTHNWVYDVTLFPKNERTEITKTIKLQKEFGYGVGSEVQFPVDVKIPAIPKGNKFDYLIVEDPMDERFGDGLRVAEVQVIEYKIGKDGNPKKDANGDVEFENIATLDPNKDYQVTVAEQKIYMGLTEKGLKFVEGKQGKQIRVVFAGTITTIGNGTVPNTAFLYVKSSPRPEEPPVPPTTPPTPPTTPPTPPTTPPPGVPSIPSNPVLDHWGNAKLLKYDGAKGEEAFLAGAIFTVHEAKNPYPENGTCEAELADDAEPITVNGVKEFVSDATGEVRIGGLFVSDSVHDTKDSQYRCYVVKEVQAPDGYLIKGNGLTAIKVTVGDTTGAEYFNAKIANHKPVIPGLPSTGSSAQVLLQAAGVLLIIGGISIYAARRNPQHNA